MSKGFLIGISSATVIIIGGILAYRYFVPPSFLIRSYIPSTHSGEVEFGGVINHFGNSTVTQGGRFGWEMKTIMNPDKTTTFNLQRNGKFIKQLAVK
jgi:hypothetical protein